MGTVNLLCEFGVCGESVLVCVMGMFFSYIVGLVCERVFEFG
jgi:hypothetical protein